MESLVPLFYTGSHVIDQDPALYFITGGTSVKKLERAVVYRFGLRHSICSVEWNPADGLAS